MIPRHPFACTGRDQGIQLYNQLMIEWQEHLQVSPERKTEEMSSKPEPGNDFIKDALSIFDSPPKAGDGG